MAFSFAWYRIILRPISPIGPSCTILSIIICASSTSEAYKASTVASSFGMYSARASLAFSSAYLACSIFLFSCLMILWLSLKNSCSITVFCTTNFYKVNIYSSFSVISAFCSSISFFFSSSSSWIDITILLAYQILDCRAKSMLSLLF